MYQQNIIQNSDEHQEKKKRKRNLIWCNPPCSINVKTNIGKVFFKLLHEHFLKTHKIFNKNTVKVSYSSMRNILSIKASHNKTILRPNIQDYSCNYRKKNECLMQNKCLTPNIYQATVTNNTNIDKKIYFGLCETSFKERYHNHTRSFRSQNYSKDAELSKYVWELKNENKILFIKWRVSKKVYPKPRFNYCKLCLMEKLYINNSIKDIATNVCGNKNNNNRNHKYFDNNHSHDNNNGNNNK